MSSGSYQHRDCSDCPQCRFHQETASLGNSAKDYAEFVHSWRGMYGALPPPSQEWRRFLKQRESTTQQPLSSAVPKLYLGSGSRTGRDPIATCAICRGTRAYHASIQQTRPHEWVLGEERTDLMAHQKGAYWEGGIPLTNSSAS